MGRLQKKKPADKKRAEKVKKSESQAVSVSTGNSVKKVAPAFQSQAKPVAPKKDNFIQRAVKFLKEVKAEVKKIIWPTRKQAVGSTLAVLVLIIIISLFLGVIDSALSWIIRLILRG